MLSLFSLICGNNINILLSAVLKNEFTRKLLWFEITKMPSAVLKNKFNVSFIIIFGSFVPYIMLVQYWRSVTEDTATECYCMPVIDV